MSKKRYLNCKYLDAGMDGMLCSMSLCTTCKEFNGEKCLYYMPKNKSEDKDKQIICEYDNYHHSEEVEEIFKDKEIISFKESLTIQANEECKNISSEISCIKAKMQEFLSKREYTIRLIEPKISPLAFGGYNNFSNIFIPKGINPTDYRRLFVKELKDLGFTDEDMFLSEDIANDYNIYKILVRW